MTIESLTGAVETRDPNDLDPDRYEWLSLDQAEPNPGNPESDGAVFVSNADGTRSWTTTPTFSGLTFKTDTLDEIPPVLPIYYLALKGDPTDENNDSIGWTLGAFEEIDTLQSVTDRGNITTNDITIANLLADSAVFTGGATVAGNMDLFGNVVITGGLTVNGEQTIINSTTLTVDDKNIVIAQGAPDASSANGAGITVEGANATITYNSSTDRWELNKDLDVSNVYLSNNLIFDAGAAQEIINLTGALNVKSSSTVISDVAGSNIFASFASGSIVLDEILTVSDSATMEGKLFLEDVPTRAGNTKVLHRRTSDGLVMEGDVEFALQSDVDKIKTEDTDSNATHYLVFTYANAGTGGFDSAYVDVSDLTYNPSTNTLSLDNLIALGLTDLDSTNVEGDIRIRTSSSVSGSGRLLDSDGRSFVVYDSPGRLLWGNNGTSAGNGGVPSSFSKTSLSVTTPNLANTEQANVDIGSAYPTYALLKIQTTHASWIRIYTDATSRTTDASRVYGDPIDASVGLITEVV